MPYTSKRRSVKKHRSTKRTRSVKKHRSPKRTRSVKKHRSPKRTRSVKKHRSTRRTMRGGADESGPDYGFDKDFFKELILDKTKLDKYKSISGTSTKFASVFQNLAKLNDELNTFKDKYELTSEFVKKTIKDTKSSSDYDKFRNELHAAMVELKKNIDTSLDNLIKLKTGYITSPANDKDLAATEDYYRNIAVPLTTLQKMGLKKK